MPLSKIQTAEMLDTPNLGRRNLIINGDMRIAQRGTSFASPTNGDYTVDRFKVYTVNDGDETLSQSTDVPAGKGFLYSLKIDVTTADTSMAADQYLTVDQMIEGQNLTHLHWGSSSAKPITVSFWVKSTLTGTYCYSIRNNAQDRSYVEDFTVNAANTWEKKTFTIQGEQTGTWLTTNGIGQIHQLSVAMGSTFIGSAGWQSNVNVVSTSNQVNLMNSTSNEFYITGWQVEVGETATPFEHRSYGEELALCQRYYYQVNNVAGGNVAYYHTYNDTTKMVSVYHPVTMRSIPLATVTGNVGTEYRSHAGHFQMFYGSTNHNTTLNLDTMFFNSEI